MKSIIFILGFLGLLMFFSCTPKTTEKVVENKAPVTPTEAPVATPDGSPVVADKSGTEVYTMLMYQKTACYGKCPTYKVYIKNDGSATYEGIMNVERIGNYRSKISQEEARALKLKLEQSGILDFANEYPTDGPKIADLPTTIIDFRIGDMIKSIRDRHDAPPNLKEMEEYIESYIENMTWEPTDR